MNENKRTGYLDQKFRLFHLKDKTSKEFDFHYHDFDKIIIFLNGNVTYFIEGKAYYLKPWDILLVNHHDIHKPIIDSSQEYERIILWVDNDYITSQNDNSSDITTCFKLADERSFNLIRLDSKFQNRLKTIIKELELSLQSKDFGSNLMSQALFIQFMVYLNRIFLGNLYLKSDDSLKYDKQIEKILNYINEHITDELSIDFLSETFYISKYYLMHKFKKETGFTLHNYILQKRLMHSYHLIQAGVPVIKASEQSGFRDYSSYLRAFKKLFHKAPSEIT
ncbi:AraC family transcriptional regulator [Candidatus Galacturonibacter soehngenii]|uniref:AraC family transcriptional regulator n=1 Tax=Candidatus Galacturonatibacter soehngenii TaxID=2307010 RepID=A0A7V7QK09_9FIRM|nr:AraC family transcriptional regulator [Candidatus Galacturonibacter soehngenii]KAB1438053.1 AraC family transcriptional regulator [Candidatus Galacturonibacter soehngenii]MBA4688768.1 AraC family transcriptional regulator [Candidatus Galacturonibacter soehngenii]